MEKLQPRVAFGAHFECIKDRLSDSDKIEAHRTTSPILQQFIDAILQKRCRLCFEYQPSKPRTPRGSDSMIEELLECSERV